MFPSHLIQQFTVDPKVGSERPLVESERSERRRGRLATMLAIYRALTPFSVLESCPDGEGCLSV